MTIEFNKVTWYSKLAAAVLFICTLILGFYLGSQSGQLQNQCIPGVVSTTYPPTIAPTPTVTFISGPTPIVEGTVKPQATMTPRPVFTPTNVVSTNKTITLGQRQTGEIQGMQITFHGVVQDSRCPIDVRCIQAGAVTINVTFEQGPHVERRNMASDEVPLTFENHKISITNVEPPTRSTKQIDQGEYKITFDVTNAI